MHGNFTSSLEPEPLHFTAPRLQIYQHDVAPCESATLRRIFFYLLHSFEIKISILKVAKLRNKTRLEVETKERNQKKYQTKICVLKQNIAKRSLGMRNEAKRSEQIDPLYSIEHLKTKRNKSRFASRRKKI
jgi:hypothetical protein